ncbi:DNA polymerase III subunit beta [Atrimonas thermophila]|uniref:DNA polymerase III subunit beta n=1 Tax=Atrimonas thermophila TaxID=3064161 RepID=UPI00399C9F14
MKIEISREELKKAVAKVYKGVSSKPPLPVLSGILMETVGSDQIKLLASDLEMGLSFVCNASVLEEGSVVAPGKVLYNLSRLLKDKVTIQVSGNNIELSSGKSFYKLSGFPAQDFPLFPPFPDDGYYLISAERLKEAVMQTSFAVSKDETRPPLTGLQFNFTEGYLELAATDGHRLSISRVETLQSGKETRVIVPQKVAMEIVRLAEGEIKVALGDGDILFESGELTLFSRLIEGEFPEYKQVIPDNFVVTVLVDRDVLLEALERVSVVVSGEIGVVDFELSDKSLVLSCVSQDWGVAKEEIPAVIDGQGIKIAFNVKYLTDALRVISWEKVSIGISGELSPTMIFGEKEDFRYVLMPVTTRLEE